LVLLATGMRPLHGILSVLYVLAYYYCKGKKYNIYKFVFIILIIIGLYVISTSEIMVYGEEKLENFDRRAMDFTGGIFSVFYSLPFPFDKIAMSIYMILQPLPMQLYLVGTGKTFLTIPYLLSPYIMMTVLGCTIYYVMKNFKSSNINTVFITTSVIVFFLINSGSPDIRRSFAAIPGLFICYILVKNDIPKRFKHNIKYVWNPIVFIVCLGLTIYTLL
jgi:hypothetical protein